MRKKIIVYSKSCFSCVYPDKLQELRNYAAQHGLELKVYRTVYSPICHAAALKYREDYRAFVVYNGKDYDIDDFIKKGAEDDLLELPEAKDTNGEDSMELSQAKAKPTAKKRTKRAKKVADK